VLHAVDALGAGALAGLGIALPFGAVSVLLVQEGITGGWRRGSAAAIGIGLVDGAYAAVAVVAGAAVTAALAGLERTVQLVGAAVLLAVAVRGLLALRTPPERGRPVPQARILRRFVALTAVNPLTAVYFVVLAAGLGEVVRDPASRAAFAAGALLTSLAWQLSLAGAASLAGARLPPWLRVATSLAGHLLVVGYAVRLALG
jgi:threonine/homoserine/homoserine lactone efflux protein